MYYIHFLSSEPAGSEPAGSKPAESVPLCLGSSFDGSTSTPFWLGSSFGGFGSTGILNPGGNFISTVVCILKRSSISSGCADAKVLASTITAAAEAIRNISVVRKLTKTRSAYKYCYLFTQTYTTYKKEVCEYSKN